MIEVGDKVRYSNEYIAKHCFFAPGQRRSKRKSKWMNRRRGKQGVMTVLAVRKGEYDWRNKKYTGDLICLDGLPFKWINDHWLRFVRRDT
jgi:hypothetical protein